MKTFFRPSSIAVIGASAREDSLGGQIINNLLYGYKEAIYPVNPNYKEIKGLRCFPTVEAIPASVDMAIVIVPAPALPARQASEYGVPIVWGLLIFPGNTFSRLCIPIFTKMA